MRLVFAIDDSKIGENPYHVVAERVNKLLKKAYYLRSELISLKNIGANDQKIQLGLNNDLNVATIELRAVEGLVQVMAHIKDNETHAITENVCEHNATDLYLTTLEISNHNINKHKESIKLRLDLLNVWEYESNLKNKEIVEIIVLLREFYKSSIKLLN